MKPIGVNKSKCHPSSLSVGLSKKIEADVVVQLLPLQPLQLVQFSSVQLPTLLWLPSSGFKNIRKYLDEKQYKAMWMWGCKPWGVGSMWFHRIAAQFMLGPLCKAPVPDDHTKKVLGILFLKNIENHHASLFKVKIIWNLSSSASVYLEGRLTSYTPPIESSPFHVASKQCPLLPKVVVQVQSSANCPGKMGQCVCCFFDVSGCEFLPNNRIKTPFLRKICCEFFSEVWMQMIVALWD